MPTVLALLAEGFEEIEAFTPVDLLRRAGADVTVASLSPQRHVTGRSGITAHADASLAEVGDYRGYSQRRQFDRPPGIAGQRLDAHVRRLRGARHCGADIAAAEDDQSFVRQ